jgi:hypothetical protein
MPQSTVHVAVGSFATFPAPSWGSSYTLNHGHRGESAQQLRAVSRHRDVRPVEDALIFRQNVWRGVMMRYAPLTSALGDKHGEA